MDLRGESLESGSRWMGMTGSNCCRALFVWLGFCSATSSALDAVGFRGDGSGRYPDATPPTTWSTETNVAWRTALTNWSNASPILVGNRIFVCAEPAMMICVSATTGAILWQEVVPDLPASRPPTHDVNGYTSSTPCSDGKRVWAVFGQGVVACWDLSGKLLWSVPVEKPPHSWGGCVSPRLAGDLVVVQYDHMFGLDAATGTERWKLKTAWGWGSPVVATVGGRPVLYTCKGSVVDGVSGQELVRGLWSLDFCSPCLVDGIVYCIQGNPQAYAVPENPEERPRALWQGVSITGDRYYATPLVHAGLVYAVNMNSQFTVMEQDTGKLVYTRRLEFLSGTAYPSPALAGDLVFVSAEDGQTLVLKAGREYQEVARNKLEPFRSSPVFAGNRMYIRGRKHLWCIGK